MDLPAKSRKTQTKIRRLIAAGIPLAALLAAGTTVSGAEVKSCRTPGLPPQPAKQMPTAGLIAMPPQARSAHIYVVKRGDTLSAIAKKHNVSVKVLRQLNDLTEEAADKLSIGQKILLPQPDNRKNERQGVNVKGKMKVIGK